MAPEPSMSRYTTFREFYPFYLGEHQNPTCRRLHFVGSLVALAFNATRQPLNRTLGLGAPLRALGLQHFDAHAQRCGLGLGLGDTLRTSRGRSVFAGLNLFLGRSFKTTLNAGLPYAFQLIRLVVRLLL